MVFLDFFTIEFLIILISFYFILSNNIMILLYNSGLYLVFMGIYSLLNEADIYIGFLWVIDLGVGLVFFIFMLHFLPFLHQKSTFNVISRVTIIYSTIFLLLSFYFYFLSFNIDSQSHLFLNKLWFFNINYLDYYFIFFSYEVTELNLLRETYFMLNTFEFFLINFSLFFGLITAILLCFLIHRIFNFLNFSQIKSAKLLNKLNSSFFIRNQNFMSQSNAPMIVKTWSRKKQVNFK